MGSTGETKKTAAPSADARVRGTRRAKIIARGAGVCVYCLARDVDMTVDHVVAVANGGTSASTNVVCACFDCNSAKADWDLDQFAERLRRRQGIDPAALARRVAAQLARPLR